MKLFKCQQCGQLLYFENIRCERCGHSLGFHPGSMELLTLVPRGEDEFTNAISAEQRYRYCTNGQYGVCNWLVEQGNQDSYCVACSLNRTVPDLNNPEYVNGWRKLESAKHRLVYTLLQLGLPIHPKSSPGDDGLAFDFLAEQGTQTKVVMGHASGLITINLAEADEVRRVSTREQLGEPYRTLLGHFRHEIGHYYWDILVLRDEERLSSFRKTFGNEQEDYGQALDRYYHMGPASDWQNYFVSAYATAHPWEDWAETWAHYFHIMDTLETAYSFGMRIAPRAVSRIETLAAEYAENPFLLRNFEGLINLWLPLTAAINSLNRSMGQPDFYPFVVSPTVIQKLSFIHAIIFEARSVSPPSAIDS